MKKWQKITIGILASLLIVIIFIAGISYYLLKSTLPDYNSQTKVAGLKSEVNIYRDQYAVPMITADNDQDAAFALG
ncbi:MAG: penicillin acylase family protein, partial [Bacteroidota bacterium]